MANPVLSDFDSSVTFDENTVNAGLVVIDDSVTLTNDDDDFDGSTFIVTGVIGTSTDEDVLGIVSVGDGEGEIHVDGTSLSYGGILIGSVTGGTVTPLTVTFNAAATTTAVEQVYESLAYANTSDMPGASRTFRIGLNDRDGAGFAAEFTVGITLENDDPDARDDLFSVNEDSVLNGNVLIDSGNGVDSDPDGDGLTVQAGDIVTAQGVTVTMQANGDFSYVGPPDYAGQDSFTYVVEDGVGGSANATVTIDIVPINDAPTIITPAAATVDENEKLALKIVAADVDDTRFFYEIIGGADADFLRINNFGNLYFFSPADFEDPRDADADSVYEVIVQVSDSGGLAVERTFAITVSDINEIEGSGGDDDLGGTEDKDAISGGKGNDVIHGEGGDDKLNGGAGKDHIEGGDGNDDIKGGKGGDKIEGGGGDDKIEAGDGHNDIYGGDGQDDIKGGKDKDDIRGGKGDDKIKGRDGNNDIYGGEGEDDIKGGKDKDDIRGGDDDDTIDAGDGNNVVKGGDGKDDIKGGKGEDDIKGGKGDDTIKAGGGNNVVKGGKGNDFIKAGKKNDTINGGRHDDKIKAGDGRNVVDGGDGEDDIEGGKDEDKIDGGVGNDMIKAGDGKDQVKGGKGKDTISGGKKADKLAGGRDDDGIKGGAGKDAVKGGKGNDMLSGDAGNDLVSGGKGNDLVSGGEGKDLLIGGGGEDAFLFDADLKKGNVDTIADFGPGDEIHLDHDVFTSLAVGALDPSAFSEGKGAKDADDRILYDVNTGAVRYDPDGIGGKDAIIFAVVGKGTDLDASDFLVV